MRMMHYIAKYNFFFEVSIILLHRKVVNKTSIFRVKKKGGKEREENKNEKPRSKSKGKHSIEISFCFVVPTS